MTSRSLSVNPRGGYCFLPAISPYSSGVVALPGYEIVHVQLQSQLPWETGLKRARHFVESQGLSHHCLCAFELRCPAPHTLEGFVEFNRQYRRVLLDWDMMVEGVNPIARTNVAPAAGAPSETTLHGLSFARPTAVSRPTFVVAGGGELPDGELAERRIVRAGETSVNAMLEKAGCVVHLMTARLSGLGVDADLTSQISVYTVHPLWQILREVIVPEIPASGRCGVHWNFARPPIVDIEFEMDMRSVVHEVIVDLN